MFDLIPYKFGRPCAPRKGAGMKRLLVVILFILTAVLPGFFIGCDSLISGHEIDP